MRGFCEKGPRLPNGKRAKVPDVTDTNFYDEEDQSSFESDRKFSNFILFTGSFALILIYMYSNLKTVKKKRDEKDQNISKAKYTGKADIGGPWTLYDTNGDEVTHRDYLGKYYLIYFGFTMCPDVCPISLQKITKAMNKVKKSKEYEYFELECIFVSLDPDRDSNRRIKEYCEIFDPSIRGLTHKTNDDPDLKKILKDFKIHSSKIYLSQEEEDEDAESLKENAPEVVEKMGELKPLKDDKYSLDHTIVTYLMGPDNEFLTYLGSNQNEHEMADIILDEVSSDLGHRFMGKNDRMGAPRKE